MKISIVVTLKEEVLDPQGKVILKTINNMGLNNIKNIRQGKYFELEMNDKNSENIKKKVDIKTLSCYTIGSE